MRFLNKHNNRIFLCGIIALLALTSRAQQRNDSIIVLPDSSNFVTASLLVITPGVPTYSALGHCALRMECPAYSLDYCFSFESRGKTKWFNYLKFFTGNTPAGFLAVPTKRFVGNYMQEGRGIKQYTLNLTHHEKQELWRYLDNDMVAGVHRNFNFIHNNCASMSLIAVESVMWKEDFDVKEWPAPMSLVNGKGVKFLTRDAPWLQFFLMSLLGSEADVYWNQEYRISPELIDDVMANADIVDNQGKRRAALVAPPTTLATAKTQIMPTKITPNVVFGTCLLLIILLTMGEWKWGWRRLPQIVDIVLFACQTILGCLLLYLTFVSCLFGLHVNWLLIPFNPLPFLLWLLFRHKRGFHRVYAFYAIVLILFVIVSPFVTTQLTVAHLLIVATLAIRCLSNYYKLKRN